jgi:hypothetical protein
MPRFHFYVRDRDTLVEGHQGAVFPDLEAAPRDTAVASRQIVAERLKAGQPLGQLQFEICDEAGQLVATVPIRVDAH